MDFMLEHHQIKAEISYDVADRIFGTFAGSSTVSVPTTAYWATSDDFDIDFIAVIRS